MGKHQCRNEGVSGSGPLCFASCLPARRWGRTSGGCCALYSPVHTGVPTGINPWSPVPWGWRISFCWEQFFLPEAVELMLHLLYCVREQCHSVSSCTTGQSSYFVILQSFTFVHGRNQKKNWWLYLGADGWFPCRTGKIRNPYCRRWRKNQL